MKDSADKFTNDILGAKRRGRPASPSPKTGAQRMREHRQKMEMYTFDLRDVMARKREKDYHTIGEAFEDLLWDCLYSHENNLPSDFFVEFPELAPDPA